ncbi:MAG TPA: CRISPR system precrRNA processing endoribonuclease RAMP protein Cas6 [Caldilineaceae bacterium]|nr:CRISPR system precrRNA processing endoribonuclease RAMP protein Cas6 [Caldilineaceae bacterium]
MVNANGVTLRSLVLHLTALEDGPLPGSLGETAHAAFYAAIQAVDPALSAQLHDAQSRAAFTLSPLRGYGRTVRAGEQGWLRVTLLEESLFAAFAHHLLAGPLPTLRLGRVAFVIHEVHGAPGSHPWAGFTTLADLAALDPAFDRWRLEFASPTAIRWGEADNGTRRVELFPRPRMAIAGLRARWDQLTGQGWGRDFEEWVERNVVVGAVECWQTGAFLFQRQRYLGGLGRLEYHLLDPSDAARAAHLNRLLHFAFYTGIGYKTTHGLGQVRVLEAGG